MSRTTEIEIQPTPCKKFLKWSTLRETIIIEGEEIEKIKGGSFTFYDKELKENVPIKLPFKFAILNKDLVTFKGYNEVTKKGIYSGEYNKPDQLVIIRNKDEKLLTFKFGEYKVNKDAVRGVSAKYTQSVYIAVLNEGEWEVWNLQLNGAAFNGSPEDMKAPTDEEKVQGWINFTKNNKSKLYSNFVEVTGYIPKKKGTNKFVIPTYELGGEIDEETAATLNELDGQLNEYLAYYFKRPETEKPSSTPELEEAAKDELDY